LWSKSSRGARPEDEPFRSSARTTRSPTSPQGEEVGGVEVEVDARNASRTCAACGKISEANRHCKRFSRVGWGHAAAADVIAAPVICEGAAQALALA